MRLISHLGTQGPTWGVQVGDGVVSRADLGSDLPASVRGLVADSARWPQWLRELPARALARSPASLPAGDTIEVEIEGVGVLANPVTD